jgi:CubicO group peptidase (beta-lactamase class C family)
MPESLESALAFARELAPAAPADLTEMMPAGKRHPNDRPIGPVKPRGMPSGLLLVDGERIADYGEIDEPEVTFSVSKSYISAVAGIAVRDRLLGDLDEPVCEKVRDGGFDSEHNRLITWRHLLHQTSEWEGELFGIPDWIDRGRKLDGASGVVGGSATGHRALQTPGTYFEYNDVRVNRLSLALLRLFNEPLPQVLKREIMDPIGASDSWQWHGYETSWVDVNGRQMQSVSGGAHWGGGIWINTRDHACFGQLYLNRGAWAGRQLLPEDWVTASTAPSPCNPAYGYLWWLNRSNSLSDIADETAFAARGAGGHCIFVWPASQVVIVLRWCSQIKVVIDRMLSAGGF